MKRRGDQEECHSSNQVTAHFSHISGSGINWYVQSSRSFFLKHDLRGAYMQYTIPGILIILSPMFLASVSDAQSRSNTRTSAAPTFQQMPGALTQISVSCGVWGVNSSGRAFYYNDVNHGWVGDDHSDVVFTRVVAGGSDSFNDSWGLSASHIPYNHGVRNSSDGSRSVISLDAM